MKIRPKNNILYAVSGVKFSPANAGGTNWRQQVFNKYRQHLLDQLQKYGEANDYGDWLNEMQHRHSLLWQAANQSGDWQTTAYENEDVGKYQQDYRGGIGNDNNYQRFGQIQLNPEDRYDFNQTGIKPNQSTRYSIQDPPKRVSGDFSRDNYNYNIDNYYSAITDDRRLLGRKGDWDENSEEYKNWIKDLNARGWTMYLDDSDSYYKLKRIPTDQSVSTSIPITNTSIPARHNEHYGLDLNKIKNGLQKILPDLIGTGRLIGNIANNERVFGEQIKGIKPDLQDSYHTYRQVVGDEATKQAFYKRAAQGQTSAAKPFTSDADRQMAYQMEAKRIGDELREKGDLADNAEIRRTSDESNQHQWQNIARDTQVENNNAIARNRAEALKHNLLAAKHAANWTSIDNYALQKETELRAKQAKRRAIQDQINLLDQQERYNNDTEYQRLYDNMQKAWEEASERLGQDNVQKIKSDPKVLQAQRAFKSYQYKLKRKQYEEMMYAKRGTKITFKQKDDLLYKTAKDAVDHFRKMVKMSSDAHNRKPIRAEKLISPPKGTTKKLQQGGVAPFTVYRPAAVGGEQSIQQSIDSSNSSSKSEKSSKNEKLDLLKDLFSKLEGLPSDTNYIFSSMTNFLAKAETFGEDLSSDELANIYLSQMQQINNIKFSKASYDEAKKHATEQDALDEFAVTDDGKFIVQNKDTGEIQTSSWSDIKSSGGKLNPLTNNNLLDIRAYDRTGKYILGAGDISLLTIVNKGIGLSKIAEFIKQQIPKLGSSEQTIEGYTKKQSNQIRQGFEQILAEAPDGDYKFTRKTEEQNEQIKMALGYIQGILPKNMKAVLQAHADIQQVNPSILIQSLLYSQMNVTDDLQFTAVSGKGSDGNGNGGSKSGTDTPASVQFLLGNGYQQMVEFNIGNSQSVKTLGRFGILQDKEKNNLGQGSTLEDVSKSQFGPILDLDKATFGGSRLTSGYSHVILNNSDCVGVDLPVKLDSNGNYVPDFQQLSTIEKAEEYISNNNITDKRQINKIYSKYGLQPKFDSNGNIIQHNYKRFAAIQVILDSKALKNGAPKNINEVQEADDAERELFIESMKRLGNKDYDLSNGFLWSSWGKDKLYKGTIFAPVRNDIVAGYISGGQPLDTDLPNNANQVALMQHAPKVAEYKEAPSLSSLK